MQMYSENDVDTQVLADKRVAILGYGSQGRAHALNLKDSGFDVVVGLRPDGGSWEKAKADGLNVAPPAEAVSGATIIAFLTPDMVQKSLYESVVDQIGPRGDPAVRARICGPLPANRRSCRPQRRANRAERPRRIGSPAV